MRSLITYLPLSLLVLVIFQSDGYAIILKLSRSSGEVRGQYGKSSRLDGVEHLKRSYSSISAEHDWGKWFGSSSFTTNNYSEDKSDYEESAIAIKIGKSFGNKSNQLGLVVGLTQNHIYTPQVGELSKASFMGKGFGVKIRSNFLIYEFFTQDFGAVEFGELSSSGKGFSHKVSLNLGKKFKYGLYYLSETYDFQGDASYLRNSQSIGAYVGYEW